MNGSWTYRHCEICLKNAHEKVEMVKRTMVSTDAGEKYSDEMWMCPKCGAAKRL